MNTHYYDNDLEPRKGKVVAKIGDLAYVTDHETKEGRWLVSVTIPGPSYRPSIAPPSAYEMWEKYDG